MEQEEQRDFEEYEKAVKRKSDDLGKRIVQVFQEVDHDYESRGLLRSFEIAHFNDIHAFYYLKFDALNPETPSENRHAIHVQGYPGLSNEEQMKVFARLMDEFKIWEIRRKGGVSVGNEHQAVIMPFDNFFLGANIPYSAEVLEKMLEKNIPWLRGGKC